MNILAHIPKACDIERECFFMNFEFNDAKPMHVKV